VTNTLVVATGNEIVGDDGIGLHIIEELKKFFLPDNIRTIYIGTDCWSLLPLVKEFEKIIVVDAVDIEGEEGEVYYIPARQLPGSQLPYSLHDICWLDMVRMAGKLDETYLFGIQTSALNIGTKVSPGLKKKVNEYTGKLYNIVT